MNVKTSFFNKYLFLNTLKKTLPYCITVSVICFLFSFYAMKDLLVGTSFFSESSILTNRQLFNYCIYMFATSAFCKLAMVVYSFIISAVVFNYLFNSKLCKTIHALPITRTTMYISNIAAGFAAIIIPYLIATITVGIYSISAGHSFFCAFPALLTDICYSTIFYSLGILSVMLTGHILATPVMFLFLNFGFFAIENLTLIVTHSMLFGLNNYHGIGHTIFTPVIYLFNNLTPHLSANLSTSQKYVVGEKTLIVFGIYTILAILLIVVSGILYKHKKLENQGDPITIKKIQPFFHYCLTIISGSVLTIILSQVFSIATNIYYLNAGDKIGILVLFIISSVISFYVLKMLFNKTVRVFKNINVGIFVYLGISVVVFVIFSLDIIGFEKQKPDSNTIASVTLSVDNYIVDTSDSEIINKTLAIHEDIIDNKEEIIKTANNPDETDDMGYYSNIEITYTRKNGKIMSRYYTIYHSENKKSSVTEKILQSTCDIVNLSASVYSTLNNAKSIEDINIYKILTEYDNEDNNNIDDNNDTSEYAPENTDWYVPEEYNAIFRKALLEDAKDGNLFYDIYTGNTDKDPLYNVSIYATVNNTETFLQYEISDKCVNTIKAIEEVIEYINENDNEDEQYY